MSDPGPVETADAPTLEFMGETFTMNAPEDYQWELLEFAGHAAGVDDSSFAGVAAVYGVLKAVIVKSEWERFRRTAKSNKAQIARDLMPLVVTAFIQRTGHPSKPLSGSAGGRQLTPPSSEVEQHARVVARLEAQGRPELAYMVEEGQAARLRG